MGAGGWANKHAVDLTHGHTRRRRMNAQPCGVAQAGWTSARRRGGASWAGGERPHRPGAAQDSLARGGTGFADKNDGRKRGALRS
jgi:hypothetical protein